MPNLLDIAYLPLALLALPRVLGKRRGGWRERFGKGDALPTATRPRLLVCAVSLGEVNLLRPLVAAWEGDAELVIASTTDTGYARARELFAREHAVIRYPLDFSWCVRRVLDRVRPDAVALVELELWPNFLGACATREIPVGVLNGRLSDRSFPRYQRFAYATGRWFRRLAFVAAQDERSAERFRALGAPGVSVAGNMKWDAASPPTDAQRAEIIERLGIDPSKPLVVAGSTAPGEHELLRDALPDGAQLLVAPRRPEWFDGAADALPGCVRWSASKRREGARFFVLDTLGKLTGAYALADVCVVGRSFGELHGSDPMEPAALGKPVLIGPSHADFRQPVRDLEAAGALRVTPAEELAGVLAGVLRDDSARAQMAARAQEASDANRGATGRHMALVREMLGIA